MNLPKIPLLKETVRKARKGRKGSMAIEIVIGCFIFLMVFCLLMDVVMLGWRFAVISQTNSYVARTVGLQGGVLNSAPNGFPGGNDAYLSTSELLAGVQRSFDKAGIASDEFSITINGRPLSQGAQIDYRDEIEISMSVDYEWRFLSNVVPGAVENTIHSTRTVVSEFKYRYDTWYGE